jgi:hypothetical protein
LASNVPAWQQLLGFQVFYINVLPPQNDLKWGITAGKNALSWPHVDANGLAITIVVTTGSRYWILMREKRCPGGASRNTECTYAFPKSWHPCRFEDNLHGYEDSRNCTVRYITSIQSSDIAH